MPDWFSLWSPHVVGFRWEHPWVLLGLLLVPALWVWLLQRVRRRLQVVLRVNARQAYEQAVTLTQQQTVWRNGLATTLLTGVVLALVLSLANPLVLVQRPQQQVQLMLVLDYSLSMKAVDLQPNRLTVSQQAAQRFVRQLPPGVAVGLQLFSGTVTTLTPPTTEKERLLRLLAGLSIQQLETNTALGTALLAAVRTLEASAEQQPEPTPLWNPRQSLQQHRPAQAIVLISDGDSYSGIPWETVLPLAQQQRIPVYTVGLGGTEPTFVTHQGNVLPVELNEASLQAIARQTGGRYYRVAEASALQSLYQDLQARTLQVVTLPVSLQSMLAGVALVTLLGLLLLV